MSEIKSTPTNQGSRAVWVNDGNGAATFDGELRIALHPDDPGRWVVERIGTNEGLTGPVLDDADDYREPHSLLARIAYDGIPVDGLGDWAVWAEGVAMADRAGKMRDAVGNAAAKLVAAEVAIEQAVEETPASPFSERVGSCKISLLEVIENGIPPVEYLPASEGIFVRGDRHSIAAPKKSGKSFMTISHGTRMALAGASVVILDRENGARRYARRLELVMDFMGLKTSERKRVDAAISYYEFPRLAFGDAAEMVEAWSGADLVVFDSQRQFLTTLGLKENDADDYSCFMVEMIEPLMNENVATLILDNAGHSDPSRARGSSAKGDIADIIFSLKKTKSFDEENVGEIELAVEDSRDGSTGCWKMELGNGVFGEKLETHDKLDSPEPKLLEQASRTVENNPGVGATKLRNALPGQTKHRDAAVKWLVAEGFIERKQQRDRAPVSYVSLRPYRA